MFCVVKETEAPEADNVPEEKMLGIAEFEDKYFCGKVYQDDKRVFWDALGSKPIFTFGTLVPFRRWGAVRKGSDHGQGCEWPVRTWHIAAARLRRIEGG